MHPFPIYLTSKQPNQPSEPDDNTRFLMLMERTFDIKFTINEESYLGLCGKCFMVRVFVCPSDNPSVGLSLPVSSGEYGYPPADISLDELRALVAKRITTSGGLYAAVGFSKFLRFRPFTELSNRLARIRNFSSLRELEMKLGLMGYSV